MGYIYKFIKKIINLNLIFVLLFASFIVPDVTYAKTLGDLKQELQKNIEEYNKTQSEKNLTQSQINSAHSKIEKASKDIEESQNEIKKVMEEIEELNNDIKNKKQQIKDIIGFYQTSGSSTAYLDYALGAQTFTDFIYRLAISEQLISYNDELVEQYNQMIIDNNKKKEDLQQKIKDLEIKQQELKQSLDILGSKLSELADITIDIEEEISSRKQAIEMYETKYGCKDSDDLSVCTRGQLPPDTKFWRPIESGGFSSEFGYRTYYLNGKKTTDFHSGIDLTAGSTDVYATAAGVVASVVYKSSCGGNKIYMHHKINGVTYTTSYLHLRAIYIKKGDVVTKDTKIGLMGGDPRVETWDRCSTGRHLHFSVAYGLYLSDYTSWNTYMSKMINPRSVVNFPAHGTRFANRTTKY